MLLALECSAGAASAAVIDHGRLLAEFYTNVKLTHSQTLMPMVEGMLSASGLTLPQMDGFAVSAGPGSFTGVRIGVAALKGMAWPLNKPCAAVSSLAAMAENLAGWDCVVCGVMDARCNQVYNALFRSSRQGMTRLCGDRALLIPELGAELTALCRSPDTAGLPVIFLGDGAELCFAALAEELPAAVLAPEHLRYQRAAGVAAAAEKLFAAGETVTAAELMPVYLRLPQAERELKKKLTEKEASG